MRTQLTLLAAAVMAVSNPLAAESFVVEEVIVTASKRATTLQEVPIAVTVTDGETIEQAQIRDLSDLQSVVPSLRVEQLGNSATTNFIIRGFGNGDNNPGIEPSVAVFVDGVYRSRSAAQIADLPSVERVEVLRGPQSTLFGKNASAGVISIVTQAPQYELGGSAEVSYGNYNSMVAKGHITGPITDQIAYSVSANVNQRDGYFDVVNLGKETNDRDRWDVRADLLFEPTDDLSIRAIADYGRIDDACCGAANIVSGPTAPLFHALAGGIAYDSEQPFSYDLYQSILSTNEIENYGMSVQIDYEVGEYSLTSITAYREVDAFQKDDRDFSAADVIGALGEGSQIETFTQELRLTSNFDGPFNFLLGAYIFDEQVDANAGLIYGSQFRDFADANLGAAGAVAALEQGVFNVPVGTFFAEGTGFINESYQLDNLALSFFGTLDVDLGERTTLTAGFNYTYDEKTFELDVLSNGVFSAIEIPDGPLQGLRALQNIPPFLAVPNAVEDGEIEDDQWTWSLRLAYDLTDNINTYVSWATGYKAASVNLTRDSRPFADDQVALEAAGLNQPNQTYGTRFAEPELSEVFEVGVKAVFERGSVNLALFDQTIEDFQSNTFTGTGFALSNAGQQSTWGVELEVTYAPLDSLNLFLSATYLDPTYDSFENSAFGDLSGQEPAKIPEVAMSIGGTYTHVFNNGNELVARADYMYESETQLRDGFLEAPQVTRELTREVKQLNASMTLLMADGLEFSVWGRNLLDEEFLVSAFDGVVQPGTVSGYPNQPRTYGGTLRYKF